MPKATLIIPTLERPDILLGLLKSLERQTERDFETVVVDQSDVANAAAKALADASNGRIVYLFIERKSLPNARNVGAQKAAGDILIFIDDDVELAAEFVAAHVARLSDAGLAAVAGRITGGYDDGPADAKIVGAICPITGSVTRNFHVTFPVDSIEQLPGGNFSVRAKVYRELGGFDPDTFGGPASIGEETDFACRLRTAGHRIAFEPKAHLIHLHAPRGGCRDDSVTRWTFWHGHNMAALRRRYSPWYLWLPFVWIQTARYFVHAVKKANPLVWPSGVWGTMLGIARGPTHHRPTP